MFGAGVGALVVSALTVAISLIYAFYAWFTPWVGAAGTSAILFVLIAAALGAASFALWAASQRVATTARPATVAKLPETLTERLSALVRERPVVVLAAAVGAGVLAIRNPRYLASALRTLATPRLGD